MPFGFPPESMFTLTGIPTKAAPVKASVRFCVTLHSKSEPQYREFQAGAVKASTKLSADSYSNADWATSGDADWGGTRTVWLTSQARCDSVNIGF
jgi:hypothetical protein